MKVSPAPNTFEAEPVLVSMTAQGVWKFNCPFGGVLTKKDGTVIEKFWRLFPPGT
jgi:hypothetical protein